MALTKAHNRMIEGAAVSVIDYGADPTGAASSTAAFQAAVNSGATRIVVPAGTYLLPKGSQTVQSYAVAFGDSTIDIPSFYAVMISQKQNLVIDAHGASFVTDSGAPFVFYRCVSCTFNGGSFTATASDATIDNDQAAAIIITRSVDCCAKRTRVDGYYRNLFAYRGMNCGFDLCYSINARYVNLYCASTIDVTLDGVSSGTKTRHYVTNCYARGAKLYNIFSDDTNVIGNVLYDLSGFGSPLSGTHIGNEQGNAKISDNYIIETSENNTKAFTGISIAPALSYITAAGPVENVEVNDNTILGNYKGISVSGANGFLISGNNVKDYYQTGISIVSDVSGGQNYTVSNGVVSNNTIDNMNDASTRTNTGNDKNAGLQVEENSSLYITNLVVSGNSVDAKGNNTTKTPSHNAYFEVSSTENSSVRLGENAFIASVANVFGGVMSPSTMQKNVTLTPRTGVSVQEFGDGFDHRTVITLTNVAIPAITGGAAQAVGNPLIDLPAGECIITSAYMSVAIQGGGSITADTPDVGIGTTVATGSVSVLGGTAAFENIITGQTAADCNGTATVKTATPTAGTPLVIAAGDSHTICVNAADTWAGGGSSSATWSGTIIINWKFLA
jgi:hypothetical protein